jgi:protein-L-isoaspartate(D-aspartate) O-methyltransferase
MSVREWLRPVSTRGDGLSALIAGAAERFTSVDDAELTPLLDRIGTSRLVLIGEASDGTSEFYWMRARDA